MSHEIQPLTPEAGLKALTSLVRSHFQLPPRDRGVAVGGNTAKERICSSNGADRAISRAAIRSARARGWAVSVLDPIKWSKLSDIDKLNFLKEQLSAGS